MSQHPPERNDPGRSQDRTIDLSEQKSITGSAQTVSFEPADDFIAPSMSLDSFESDPEA